MSRQYGQPKYPPKAPAPGERKDREPSTKAPDPSPNADTVRLFHKNAQADTRPEDIHHSLGISPNQAAPGNHNHDGGNSPLILLGYTIVGSKASPSTVLPSIIAALVRLGATDSTT